MIRLQRSDPPPELDAQTETNLKTRYVETGESVWNVDYIKARLLISSHQKCGYCETNLVEESKYMEVEHFRCKADFPDLVVAWENLIPSCKRCNGRKGSYNVEIDGMIVNPYENNPIDHFYFQNYRLRWRDEIGRSTIGALYLNDTERVVSVRMQIGERITSSLEVLREQTESYLNGNRTVRARNRITRGIEILLEECRPAAQFSALASTILMSDANYVWIRDRLIELDLWENLAPLDMAAADLVLLP